MLLSDTVGQFLFASEKSLAEASGHSRAVRNVLIQWMKTEEM